MTVGIPNCRIPFPSGFGISTRRTGRGRYVPSRISCLIAGHCLNMTSSITSVVMPSIPGAPLLRLTAASATYMFQEPTTRSIVTSESCWLPGRNDSSFPALSTTAPYESGTRLSPDSSVLALDCSSFLRLSVVIEVGSFLCFHVRAFSGHLSHPLCPLLTAVPFTSSILDTASAVVPLFCRVLVGREHSSHRVSHYTFLLARRIYTVPSEQVLDFEFEGTLIQGTNASYALPVRQASILDTAFFRFRLATDTLAFPNGSPY